MPVLFVAKKLCSLQYDQKTDRKRRCFRSFTIYDVNNDPDGSIARMTDELKRDYGLAGAPFVDPRDLGLDPFVGFCT